MSAADEGKIDRDLIDRAVVEELYRQHGDELRRLLIGVLRDESLANDAFQATFAKALERGHTANSESRKGWLFRVAYNEAMLIRRRQATGERAVERVAWTREHNCPAADTAIVVKETVEQVRRAIAKLSPDQQRIVRMRIYDEKKFVEIAEELQIPLGTALGRMRNALAALKQMLAEVNGGS